MLCVKWCVAIFILCSVPALPEAAPRPKNSTSLRGRSRGKSFVSTKKRPNDVNGLTPEQQGSSCVFEGKLFSHGSNVSRSDPCETCLCFRGEIICWEMHCPTYVLRPHCREVKVKGVCCPILECEAPAPPPTTTSEPVNGLLFSFSLGTEVDHKQLDCEVDGEVYKPHEVIPSASGPCMECRCGNEAQMKCSPRPCTSPLMVPGSSMTQEPVRIMPNAAYRRSLQ